MMADENDNTRWQLGDTVHIPLADDDTPQAPPLDDDLLPSIKYRYETHYKGNEDMPVMLESDLPWLIAEVDRLRAREAAAMAIVRKVAAIRESGTGYARIYANIDALPYDAQISTLTIMQARALLADRPADTAEELERLRVDNAELHTALRDLYHGADIGGSDDAMLAHVERLLGFDASERRGT